MARAAFAAAFVAAIAAACPASAESDAKTIQPSAEAAEPEKEVFSATFVSSIEPSNWDGSLAVDIVPTGAKFLSVISDGVISSPALQAYVDGIAERLLEVSPIQAAPIEIYVTASSGYGDLYSLPDGSVALSIGFILSSQSADEVAAMIGHEMSHVLLNHHDKSWLAVTQRSLIGNIEVGLDVLSRAERVGVPFGAFSGTSGTVLEGLWIGKSVLAATEQSLNAWQRDQEREADLLAFDLLAAAGYDPGQMLTVMSKLALWEQALLTQETGPNSSSEAQSQLDPLSSGFAVPIDGLFDSVGEAIGEAFGGDETHDTPTDRARRLNDYYDQAYADFLAPPPATEAHRTTLAEPTVAALIVNYQAAWESVKLATQGDRTGAIAQALASTKNPTEFDSLPLVALAQTQAASGDATAAVATLELATAQPSRSFRAYWTLSELQWAQGNKDIAVATLEAAYDYFDRAPHILPALIKRHRDNGQPEKSDELLYRCKQGGQGYTESCEKAHQGGWD